MLLLFPAVASAQLTTVNPDTVCYQSSGSIYQITNVPGETYVWTVAAPGVLVSGQGSNAISVDWSAAAPGTIPAGVSVYAINQYGCPGPPIALDIFILNVIPTVVPGAFCVSEPCANLIGTPTGPGTYTWSGPGVSGTQFCPSLAGVGSHTVTYTYEEAGCVFSATGVFDVYPLPSITPINHN
jgi:hypothetical protein